MFTDFNITTNSKPDNTSCVGYVGDFRRGTYTPQLLRNVAELDKYFGKTQGAKHYEEAKALLKNNIMLQTSKVTKALDSKSSISFGGNIETPIDLVTNGQMSEIILASTIDDGISNIEDLLYSSVEAVPRELGLGKFVNYSTNVAEIAVYVKEGVENIASTALNDSIVLTGLPANLASLNGLTATISYLGNFSTGNYINGTYYKFRTIRVTYAVTVPTTVAYGRYDLLNSVVEIDRDAFTYFDVKVNGSAGLVNSFGTGDNLVISDSAVSSNNKTVVIKSSYIDGADLVIAISGSLTAEINTLGKITYRDRAVEPTITVNNNYADLLYPGAGVFIDNGFIPYISAVDGVSDTVITLNKSQLPSNFTDPINKAASLVLSLQSVLILSDADNSLTLANPTIAVTNNGSVPTAATISDVKTANSLKYVYLDTLLPPVYTGSTNAKVLLTVLSGAFTIETIGYGNYADVYVQLLKINANKHILNVFDDGVLLEAVTLNSTITNEEVVRVNSILTTVKISAYLSNTVIANFLQSAFPYNASSVATLTELTDSNNAFLEYASKISALMVTTPNEATAFKNHASVQVFKDCDGSTEAELVAISNTYSEWYNIQLTFGKVNNVPIVYAALKAFLLKQNTNVAHPYTRAEYDAIGYGGEPDTTSYFDYDLDVLRYKELGFVVPYTETGVFGFMRLTNNTTPYKDAPANRHNVATTVQAIYKFVAEMAYGAKDFDLDFETVAYFNGLLTEYLEKVTALESYLILDDNGVGSSANLKYNTLADWEAGKYKIGLELKFENTINKVTLNFSLT